MNILASMSTIAGELALTDALSKTKIKKPKSILVIGTGISGMAAIKKACQLSYDVFVGSANKKQVESLNLLDNVKAFLIDKTISLEQQQKVVLNWAKISDVIITTARTSGQKAPLLFPKSSLQNLKQGTCIIDLALSEGGNAEVSQHDKDVILDNNVIVSNTSGYPKATPKIASKKWSLATRLFIENLSQPKQKEKLSSCLIKNLFGFSPSF